MANISEWLNKIKSAIYGREVRSALHDSIDAVNKETETNTESCRKLREDLTEHSSKKSTSSIYAHVALSDSTNSSLGSSSSIAATPKAVKVAYDEAVNAKTKAEANKIALDQEIVDRKNADKQLETIINQEIEDRENSDAQLKNLLDQEIDNRSKADESILSDISDLESNSHTHDNKEILDTITTDDIEKWNGIKEQVTQEQLDEHAAYNNEQIVSLIREISLLYAMLGVVIYDGGIFEQEYNGIELDGGDFDNEPTDEFDCGDFEPLVLSAQINAVLDCGTY